MAGPYRVDWAATAKRDLTRLPEKIATAAVEFIYGGLNDNPRRVGRELHFDLSGFHAARCGDFRVIIDDEGQRILIATISHRADVYRPR